MFNLKTDNHEVILTSERYTTKAACTEGIESVRKNASLDANDQTIGKSEMYSSAGAVAKGITAMKANTPDAAVKDLCQSSRRAAGNGVTFH